MSLQKTQVDPYVTVQQHILEGQKRFPGASGDFSWLLASGEDLIVEASTADLFSYTIGYILEDV